MVFGCGYVSICFVHLGVLDIYSILSLLYVDFAKISKINILNK